MIGDIASTAYFVINGWANLEANVVIHNLGWYVGGLITLIMNFVVLWFLIFLLQKERMTPLKRFGSVTATVGLMTVRTLAIVNNVLSGGGKPTEPVLPITTAQMFHTWLIIFIIYTTLFLFASLCFYIYSKSNKVDYDEEGSKWKVKK